MKTISFGNIINKRDSIVCGEKKKTLIIAGIGTSLQCDSIETEKKKVQGALAAGADIISDHSFFGDIDGFQRDIVRNMGVHLSIVASYELSARFKNSSWKPLSKDNVLSLLKEQIDRGTDIITMHASFIDENLSALTNTNRIIPMTSKGGGIIADYMKETKMQNPYWEYFGDIVELLKGTGVAISLGTTFRPASVCDGWDDMLTDEVNRMGNLVQIADCANVPIMVEGLGHVSIDKIPEYVLKTKSLCCNAPYRILTVASDRALGNDHIASAISVALAVANGANLISTVTRREHIGRPSLDDLIEGVNTAKVAAEIGELVSIGDFKKEALMSKSRWKNGCQGNAEYAINPKVAIVETERSIKNDIGDSTMNCSMCGDYCGLKFAHSAVQQDCSHQV